MGLQMDVVGKVARKSPKEVSPGRSEDIKSRLLATIGQMRRGNLSPAYTTSWDELATVLAK